VRSLSIRPFATTQKYAKPDVDVQQAGNEMHVGRIVTGHYQKVRNELQLTLEAIEVGDNRVLWQETMSAPAEDLVAMREQVTWKVRAGLIPVLGANTSSEESGTRPKNEEAYDLYLRSIALAHDGEQNKEAVRMLERSVGLDTTYAPAWGALGKRYYYEEEYGPGSTGTMIRTEPTLRRAIALDPNLEGALQQIISLEADGNRLPEAFRDAKALVAKRPQSGFAHFTLSYVLRYGGTIKEAQGECKAALRLDPGNYQFRSCSVVFSFMGDFEGAKAFVDVDAGSEWSNNVGTYTLLEQNRISEALPKLKQLPDSPFFRTRATEGCYTTPRPAGFEKLMEQTEREILAFRDPEPKFGFAGRFNPCMGNAFTARLIKASITGGYCSYDYLRAQPILADFRKSAEYPAVLEQARQCKERFLTERDRLAGVRQNWKGGAGAEATLAATADAPVVSKD
jgi:tetratricopeptide (TPR) repeat protein